MEKSIEMKEKPNDEESIGSKKELLKQVEKLEKTAPIVSFLKHLIETIDAPFEILEYEDSVLIRAYGEDIVTLVEEHVYVC